MLQKYREVLTLALLALLPFHAFLITVATRVILGPGHAPIGVLALWKEALLGVILMLAIVEYTAQKKTQKIDLIDGVLGVLLLLAATFAFVASDAGATVYGLRYDFLAPVAFLVLRRAAWSPAFFRRLLWVIVSAGSVVALYAVVALFLPDSFFRALGYSDLHSLYVPGGPLAPYQQLGGSALRRAQSVMSGPNQLGLWLLLPWSLLLLRTLGGLLAGKDSTMRTVKRVALLCLVSVALALTFSRSAWIAAAVIGTVLLWRYLPRQIRLPVLGVLATSGVLALSAALFLGHESIVRSVSNRGHIERPLEAIRRMIENPLGHGLGSAGPASNRVSDACVYLEAGTDASWAKSHPELCVFVGDVKAQPTDRDCTCPFLPENWYLQIGVELGFIGMALWVGLTFLLIKKLWSVSDSELRIMNYELGIATSVFSAFLGVSIAGLFLHSWEDGAVALTLWILAATILTFPSPSRAASR